MASLKEIKTRISSVKSTLKTTSAMKMVSSAKLHRAQAAMGNLISFEAGLAGILSQLRDSLPDAFTSGNGSDRVAVVAFSSSGSLCGSFNANVIKEFHAVYDALLKEGRSPGDIEVYVIGRKIAEDLRKRSIAVSADWSRLSEKQDYAEAAELADLLTERFLDAKVGRVILVYSHFASAASCPPVHTVFLPFDAGNILAQGDAPDAPDRDVTVEPDAVTLAKEMLPMVLRLKFHTVLLDTTQAEHAARTVAMQTATDNGEKLLDELTLEYNKRRQMAITNEILDIVGGSMA